MVGYPRGGKQACPPHLGPSKKARKKKTGRGGIIENAGLPGKKVRARRKKPVDTESFKLKNVKIDLNAHVRKSPRRKWGGVGRTH